MTGNMRNQFKQFQIMQFSYRLPVQFKEILKIRNQSTDHLQSTLVSIFLEYLTLRIREVYRTSYLTIQRKMKITTTMTTTTTTKTKPKRKRKKKRYQLIGYNQLGPHLLIDGILPPDDNSNFRKTQG